MGLDIDLYTPKIDIGDDGADDIIIEITGLKSISKFIGLEDTPLYYDNGKFFKVEDNKIIYTDIEWKDIKGNVDDSPEIVKVISDLVDDITDDIIDEKITLHNHNRDAHPYIQDILQDNYNTLNTKIDEVGDELSQEISHLSDNLNTEIENRETADNTLSETIQNETLARIEADSTLQNNIGTLSDNLNTEINNRTNADNLLREDINEISGNLAQEILNRQTQDNLLQEQITSNYNTLDDKIDTEISNRTSADTTLQNNIDTEALTRQNADVTLQGNIDTEALARQNADATLQDNIDALSDTVSDNYTDLDSKISNLTTTVNNNDTTINNKVDGINTTLTTSINNLSNTVSNNYTTLDAKIDNTKTSLEGNISDLSNTVNQNYTDLSNAITTSTSTINSRIDSEVSTLNTAIGTETTNRQNADNNLQSQIDAIVSSSDVFDIVGTYAELQAYDISIVPVNDIVKVLVDSSHNNTATYYRCVETSGVKSWSYIGSEGAYYTKSEADTKFVAKTTTINNKPLSSNITLTASDVNALPDTTVIGNGILTLQKNGVNIDTFNANATANKNINITVPTDTADLTNGAGFITSASLPTVNNGTLDIQVNGTSVGTFTANQAGNTTANIVVPNSATWGNITGILSDQTDLQDALNKKQDKLTAGENITIEEQQEGWTPAVKDSNLGGNGWFGVAYDGTKFVAISDGGYVSTSTDGTTWTSAVKDSNLGENNWSVVAYGNNKFVAIGYRGYVSTSTDGTTWTSAVKDSNLGENYWLDVAYGNNKFVAIGYGGYVSTSADGTTWTPAVPDSNLGGNGWARVAYGNNKFVAIGYGGYVSTSADGTTWTSAVKDSNLGENNWSVVAYGNNKFVAIGYRGYVSTSADGTTWTPAVPDSNLGGNYWSVVAYDGTKFVAISDGGYVSQYFAGGTIISATVPSLAWGSITGTLSNQTDLQTALNSKYDASNPDGYITSSDLTNYVTTDTAQNISGRKTFLGEKAIYFKQNTTSDKLGFTLYNPSSTELGALEWRPNTINGNALLALNCPQTGSNYVGFRYWSGINIVAPRPTTNGNYFIPVNVTDGTNTVTADNNGTLNISTLLPDVSNFVTNSSLATTLTDYQPLLVSGTNIKTINNTSLLGSGNIDIDSLPTQTGNNGKFLTTNGTTASWANTTKVTIRDWSVS